MNNKLAIMLAGIVIVAGLAWRQMNGRLVRVDLAPSEPRTTPEIPTAELMVANDGSYRLDGKPVMASDLTTAVASLRAVKRGIKIDVLAAPGAPLAAIATAVVAARDPEQPKG